MGIVAYKIRIRNIVNFNIHHKDYSKSRIYFLKKCFDLNTCWRHCDAYKTRATFVVRIVHIKINKYSLVKMYYSLFHANAIFIYRYRYSKNCQIISLKIHFQVYQIKSSSRSANVNSSVRSKVQRRGALFISLLSWLAVEVLSPCWK